MSLVATYGTLRLDQGNYRNIISMFGPDAMMFKDQLILQGLSLYSLGIIPACVPDPEGQLTIDLFEVTSSAQDYIDILEGGYMRGTITLKGDRHPYIYYLERPQSQWVHIPHGDWAKYESERKARYLENWQQ